MLGLQAATVNQRRQLTRVPLQRQAVGRRGLKQWKAGWQRAGGSSRAFAGWERAWVRGPTAYPTGTVPRIALGGRLRGGKVQGATPFPGLGTALHLALLPLGLRIRILVFPLLLPQGIEFTPSKEVFAARMPELNGLAPFSTAMIACWGRWKVNKQP